MSRPRLKSNLDKVLELIPLLEEEELQTVDQRLKALSQFSRVSHQTETEDYLLQGIFYEVENMGLTETIPKFFRIKNRSSFNAYGRKSEAVRHMLERHVPDLTLPEKIALGRLAIKCLCEFMEKYRVIEFSTLLYSIERVPAALENAFPEYLGNGALKFIVRAFASPVVSGNGPHVEDAFDC